MSNMIFDVPFQYLILLGVNFLLILILFIMNFSNRSKLKKLRARYTKFMNGLSNNEERSIEQMLDEYITIVNDVKARNREIENHINYIERNLMQCVQKIGVIRYNAFENVGSDLSFAIALLDSSDNGMVLSGIYSRDSSSTYAKPIIAGKSRYPLSAEEIQALDIAKKTYSERLYKDK